MSRADYVHNLTDGVYLPVVQAIAACTPPGARIMLLFEHRGLYIPRTYTIGTPFFQAGPLTPPERFTDGQRILEVLRQNRITHVVMTRMPAGPDHAPDGPSGNDSCCTGCTSAYSGAGCTSSGNGNVICCWKYVEHVWLNGRVEVT